MKKFLVALLTITSTSALCDPNHSSEYLPIIENGRATQAHFPGTIMTDLENSYAWKPNSKKITLAFGNSLLKGAQAEIIISYNYNGKVDESNGTHISDVLISVKHLELNPGVKLDVSATDLPSGIVLGTEENPVRAKTIVLHSRLKGLLSNYDLKKVITIKSNGQSSEI